MDTKDIIKNMKLMQETIFDFNKDMIEKTLGLIDVIPDHEGIKENGLEIWRIYDSKDKIQISHEDVRRSFEIIRRNDEIRVTYNYASWSSVNGVLNFTLEELSDVSEIFDAIREYFDEQE